MKNAIHAIIRQFGSKGASIGEITPFFEEQTSRRTLLRILTELVSDGALEIRGKGRGTRYLAAPTPAPTPAPPSPAAPNASELGFEPIILPPPVPAMLREDPDKAATPQPELSADAHSLRLLVRQPLALRKPVSYNRSFLDSYQPGVTWYLPANLREKLRSLGQSPEMAEMPPGTYARRVLDRLLIDLSWNSSRLEGNTYSLLETDHLLAHGQSQHAERYVETQMILNHKAAIEFLVESPGDLGYNRYTFLNLHAVLTDGLLQDRGSEGCLRTRPVGIGGSVFHPSSDGHVISECFDQILAKTAAIPDALEQCFFLMTHLPYLQPFEDGNKRTSRLAANIPLIQGNISPISYVEIPVRDYTDGILAVYELNRIEILRDVFAWAFERSAARYAAIRKEIGNPEPARVRYREEIKARARDVVVRMLGKLQAAQEIRRWASVNITASDRAYFIELVESELLGLRETNIVRVRVRPSEFHAWWPIWQGKGT